MKYIILADSSVGFETPRQLTKINNEELIKRTIRLLKENNIKDILITSHDKRFDNLGAKRYEPLHNDYIPKTSGYWLNAFPIELLNEPICFLFGDVYYSENAIKTIVNTTTNSTLFFCTYNNKSIRYIKHHDEPLAYKVVDYNLFKEHIEKVKTLKDENKCCREPIVWELYRSIHNQDINKHVMTTEYVAINDESCDIDTKNDIIKLQIVIGGKFMVKLQAIRDFTLEEFNKIKIIKRKDKNEYGHIYNEDIFECDEEEAKYLTGENEKKVIVAEIIEIEPQKEIEEVKDVEKLKTISNNAMKKAKKKSKK